MTDARFEDAAEGPLSLMAADAGDLAVISALAQDAVFPSSEMRYDPRRRDFALLVNRFRWEDRLAAEAAGRAYERVQAVIAFSDVLAVHTQGIDRGDPDLILSLLAVDFAPGPDGTGTVTLTLAGDGAVALDVESLNVALRDVTRPYLAPSRRMPDHGA